MDWGRREREKIEEREGVGECEGKKIKRKRSRKRWSEERGRESVPSQNKWFPFSRGEEREKHGRKRARHEEDEKGEKEKKRERESKTCMRNFSGCPYLRLTKGGIWLRQIKERTNDWSGFFSSFLRSGFRQMCMDGPAPAGAANKSDSAATV